MRGAVQMIWGGCCGCGCGYGCGYGCGGGGGWVAEGVGWRVQECGASRDSTEILRDCVVLRLLLRFPKTFDFTPKMEGHGAVFLGSQRY